MEFGILFTSHPNTDTEPYPHREVHTRVTQQILPPTNSATTTPGSPNIISATNTASCRTCSSMPPISRR